jgi:hypothetical protein
VKYLLMIYQNPAAWQAMPESEKKDFMSEAGAIVDELIASGEWVGGEGLAGPATAASVRVRDGVPAVTDGPFAEAKEQVVGYCIVDCESRDRAIEIAIRWPDARRWGMEVRPILSPDGVEM